MMGWLETPTDIQHEDQIASFLRKAWHCDIERQPQGSRVDWKFYRYGLLEAVGDFRWRYNKESRYSHVWLEVNKAQAILEQSNQLAVIGIWVVHFEDPVVRWIKVGDTLDFPREFGGRTDRGLAQDRDLMILVPVKKMRVVKTYEIQNRHPNPNRQGPQAV